jgi:hypothetical protein
MERANQGVWRKEYATFCAFAEQDGCRIIQYQQPLVKRPTSPRYAVQVWDESTNRFITIHRTSREDDAKRFFRRFAKEQANEQSARGRHEQGNRD